MVRSRILASFSPFSAVKVSCVVLKTTIISGTVPPKITPSGLQRYPAEDGMP
jgi:hypothetical protein